MTSSKRRSIDLIEITLDISMLIQHNQTRGNFFASPMLPLFSFVFAFLLKLIPTKIKYSLKIYRGLKPLFYCFFNLVVKASPSTKIFFLFIPAGNAKISTKDRKTIKSNGNLPIPHSEKAKANVVICIFIFSWQPKYIREY